MPKIVTLKDDTLTLIRAFEMVCKICDLAETCGITLMPTEEIIFAHSPLRIDLPQRGSVERISGRIVIFKHENLGQWSLQFLLRCGDHVTRAFRREIYLQCDFRRPNICRYTVRIKDLSGLTQQWLDVLEEPEVNQVFRGSVNLAVLLKSKARFFKIAKAMMKFYAEQPVELIESAPVAASLMN